MRGFYRRYEQAILGVVGLALFVGLWEVAAAQRWINPVVLSRPSAILGSFQRQWAEGTLPLDLRVSGTEFVVGFALSVAIGVTLGVAMSLSRTVEWALDPFVWFFYSAPLVALYPVIIVWLGYGFWTVIVLTVFFCVVPITVNTVAGMRGADPVLVRAVRAFGGSRWDVVRTVMLPGALPLMLAGIRIGLGRALIGVIVGELFSANVGLGFRLTYYGARLRTTDVLVPLIVIIVIGVAVTQAILLLERRVTAWRAA